ncbi:FUSC family protein [Mucilaginibacter sp. SP1R1]|uniref:FUSC family protein n=1 Tax=Mucilaginibacter sp. SP1R1 TaxID=2723091 RepID=UPI001619341C|nr:FUSC family protein [Mucilaginibacter sp. SP1R1]MBB6152521.1 putative membrane protein YccC [Mucilaginibacter sp. SP1R1]
MRGIELNKAVYLANVVYLTKCLAGVTICYLLYKYIPQYPFYWAIVSVAVALSPDNSNQLAYDRMKANMLGCGVGLCLYPLHLPNLLILCLGVAVTIGLGITFQITNTLRSALAALVIVTIQEELEKHWYIALERVACVVAGCLVALMVTMLCNVVIQAKRGKQKA